MNTDCKTVRTLVSTSVAMQFMKAGALTNSRIEKAYFALEKQAPLSPLFHPSKPKAPPSASLAAAHAAHILLQLPQFQH